MLLIDGFDNAVDELACDGVDLAADCIAAFARALEDGVGDFTGCEGVLISVASLAERTVYGFRAGKPMVLAMG